MEVEETRALLVDSGYAVVPVAVDQVRQRLNVRAVHPSSAAAERYCQRKRPKVIRPRAGKHRQASTGPIELVIHVALEGLNIGGGPPLAKLLELAGVGAGGINR